MFKALISKLKESAVSVFPVAIIVLLLDCTPLLNLSLLEAVVFACCAIALVLGMALFNLGADDIRESPNISESDSTTRGYKYKS